MMIYAYAAFFRAVAYDIPVSGFGMTLLVLRAGSGYVNRRELFGKA